jgi:TrmH family RNA methyltransferase
MRRPQSRPYHCGYGRSLRPCLAPPSAPRRRGITTKQAPDLITSAANPRLRLIRRLGSRSQRAREGLFVVEGEDLVQAARTAGIEPVDLLVAGETVAPELLAELSTLAHPPRVLGIYRRDDLPRGTRPLGLALWRVHDPGNVGTLIRTADAFDASVALSSGCGDPTGPKALRASMGAIFRVPTGPFDDAPSPRVALVSRGGTPLPDLDVGPDATFVLGAERAGLPEDVLRNCDALATIPQSEQADSLNVAAAGAIALYESARRRPA